MTSSRELLQLRLGSICAGFAAVSVCSDNIQHITHNDNHLDIINLIVLVVLYIFDYTVVSYSIINYYKTVVLNFLI